MFTNADLERLNADGHNPYARLIGIEFEFIEADRCRAAIDVRDELFHPGGIVHGGVAFSLVDTCMAHAVMAGAPKEQNCSTIEIKISYLSPVTQGRITGEAVVIRRGKRVCFVEARVDQDTSQIAAATGTFALLEPRPREEKP